MRAVLTIIVAAVLLLGPGSAQAGGSSSGAPKSGLSAYGYHLYGEYCLRCHGGNAAGGGVAPSLHGVGARAGDFYLRTGYMPLPHLGMQPVRRPLILGDHQIRALVAYIANFGGPPIPTPQPSLGNVSQGLALFTEHCAGCHQVVAQGGYVTGALPPPLIDATPLQIAEAVRIGPYVMPEFSQHAISNRQLDSIISYVEYAKHPARPGGWGLGFLGPVPEGLVTWFVAIPALLGLCLVLGRRFRS
jgi:ubiquinol-cytochrome c reductase cytochrome c subunit